MKCLCNPTYTHAQSEKLIDAGTFIYVNMVIVHRLISILCFFGHSHSSIDNSYELFICCTCYDNLYIFLRVYVPEENVFRIIELEVIQVIILVFYFI